MLLFVKIGFERSKSDEKQGREGWFERRTYDGCEGDGILINGVVEGGVRIEISLKRMLQSGMF
jgi:hypothetical protein